MVILVTPQIEVKGSKEQPQKDASSNLFDLDTNLFNDSFDDSFLFNNIDEYDYYFTDYNIFPPKTENVQATSANQTSSISIQNQPNSNKASENKSNNKKNNYTKYSVPLTADGKVFREMFDYHLDKNHKKIPKTVVKHFFNLICGFLNLPKMSRDEERSINKFFNKYACLKFKIINAISQYIEEHPEKQKLIDESHGNKEK